jgi:hypothetical protein
VCGGERLKTIPLEIVFQVCPPLRERQKNSKILKNLLQFALPCGNGKHPKERQILSIPGPGNPVEQTHRTQRPDGIITLRCEILQDITTTILEKNVP